MTSCVLLLRSRGQDPVFERVEGSEVSSNEQTQILDVLELSLEEACEVFAEDRKIAGRLAPLVRVGLGYLMLGQPTSFWGFLAVYFLVAIGHGMFKPVVISTVVLTLPM